MPNALPNHVAVIMDGNGRWARSRLMPRAEGHRRGMESLRGLISCARKIGLSNLSVFAFSSENWNRPESEVSTLMRLFASGLKKEAKPLFEAGVRLKIVGDIEAFDAELRNTIREAEEITQGARGMRLNVCANYSGRWDITQAAVRASRRSCPITKEAIEENLCFRDSGPVDLMIRTGGESRISNFILWQSAYAELWFTDTLWPDFSESEFMQALQWFAGRQRRFGLTGEQIEAGQAPG